MHKVFLLLGLTVWACAAYILMGNGIYQHFQLQSHSIPLQQALLRAWLRRNHTFFPAVHQDIATVGRWLADSHGAGQSAGFSGSRLLFEFGNSTSLYVALTKPPDCRTVSGLRLPAYRQTCFHPTGDAKEDATMSPVVVKVGDSAYLFQHPTSGIVKISQFLAPDTTYFGEIKVLSSSTGESAGVHVDGIWLSDGGNLIAKPFFSKLDAGRLLRGTVKTQPTQARDEHKLESSSTVVEIVSLAMKPSHDIDYSVSGNKDITTSYDELLEYSDLFNISVTLLSPPSKVCLTSICQSSASTSGSGSDVTGNGAHSPTIQDLYFRSGPPTTTLYHKPWTWSTTPNAPTILILDLDLSDFTSFLSTQRDHAPSLRELNTFTKAFIKAYTNLILTIRRTRWHKHTAHQDQTYAYNSAPSDLTILTMVPILHPYYHSNSQGPELANAIYTAVRAVVFQLRTHEGDKQTHMIDTTGWLDETDFLSHTAPLHQRQPTSPSHNADNDYDNSNDTPLTPQFQPHQQPTPNARGHRKIAHFLSLHLCPHVARDPATCPFDRPDDYRGNLYVPDEAVLSKMLTERKIERIKALVGGF